jgi:hypothetical protein
MEVIFSEDELRLLATMHASARAFDLSGMFVSRQIAVELGWDQVYLEKIQSYLSEWNLIAHGNVPGGGWANFHLTGTGENFMRHLERELRTKQLPLSGSLTGDELMKMEPAVRQQVLETAAQVMGRLTS